MFNSPVLIICVMIVGPLFVFFPFYSAFRNRIKPGQTYNIVILLYGFSVATFVLGGDLTGFKREDEEETTLVLAAVLAPLVYCTLLAILSRFEVRSVSARKAPSSEAVAPAQRSESPTRSSRPTEAPGSVGQSESRRGSWNPVIVAAVIQAIVTIIVALIGRSK